MLPTSPDDQRSKHQMLDSGYELVGRHPLVDCVSYFPALLRLFDYAGETLCVPLDKRLDHQFER
ncbi:hypothetical protein [Hyphomicrobium denitrificans]|jgi:hypothetical protein|uniref:hypothetical protein n=1 Tax=Hyphomicrobium denitrificans TaxID=53399 RepID=UPI0002D577DE|nr:hypothetical protein [Hyphomicrobium denitrificans]